MIDPIIGQARPLVSRDVTSDKNSDFSGINFSKVFQPYLSGNASSEISALTRNFSFSAPRPLMELSYKPSILQAQPVRPPVVSSQLKTSSRPRPDKVDAPENQDDVSADSVTPQDISDQLDCVRESVKQAKKKLGTNSTDSVNDHRTLLEALRKDEKTGAFWSSLSDETAGKLLDKIDKGSDGDLGKILLNGLPQLAKTISDDSEVKDTKVSVSSDDLSAEETSKILAGLANLALKKNDASKTMVKDDSESTVNSAEAAPKDDLKVPDLPERQKSSVSGPLNSHPAVASDKPGTHSDKATTAKGNESTQGNEDVSDNVTTEPSVNAAEKTTTHNISRKDKDGNTIELPSKDSSVNGLPENVLVTGGSHSNSDNSVHNLSKTSNPDFIPIDNQDNISATGSSSVATGSLSNIVLEGVAGIPEKAVLAGSLKADLTEELSTKGKHVELKGISAIDKAGERHIFGGNTSGGNNESGFGQPSGQSQGTIGNSQNREGAGMAETVKGSLFSQLVEKAHLLQGPQAQKILTLQLKPEFLGKVDMFLTSRDGTVTARILTDNPAVRDQLEAIAPQIKQHLAEQGVVLQQLTVDISSKQPDDHKGGSFSRDESEKSRSRLAGVGRKDAVETISVNDAQAKVSEDQNIDITI
ncbi:MAG: flagellar hook-length control protein FliK [Candidatus Riflebacteria bacterium]|nr:flagellar hook-length control protein FliK [Candidatus Riflebacteria bacterium]